MKCEIKNKFKGEINGIKFDDEQSYNYLKEFIENLEYKYNLNIVDKETTEFLKTQLYEKTEQLYQEEYSDCYEEAHNEAVCYFLGNNELIEILLRFSKDVISI